MEEKGTLELEAIPARSPAHDDELKRARDERDQLRQLVANLERERDTFESQLNEIQSSLSWLVVLRIVRLRSKLFRPGTFQGRCWALASRFANTARKAGLGVALRRVRERVVQKIGKARRGHGVAAPRFLGQAFRQGAAADRFRELPWRFLGQDQGSVAREAGHFKVLLVSHSACRTGAPLCLLRLAEELSNVPGIACFVVLIKGGELADSFARLAPTLDVERLQAQGIKRHDVPRLIASTFHAFSSRGVAVCNTLAASPFHEALAEFHVEVLSWIHELPTFISLLGGHRSIDLLARASRKIMVPSQAVRAALVSGFQIDGNSIKTIYNGQDPHTIGLDRESLRREIRRELGLPTDAKIVLGCGTVDLRKGADVFVSVARRVLLDEANTRSLPGTWFVWVGDFIDPHLRRWLLHDSGVDSLGDRIRFIGPRSTVAPYYMAADLFALTSREDPCPLVNMEAMESGLAVVAFSGAGGAPEVLGDAGICVPYIDQAAMAAAIRDLLKDDRLRLEMGRRGSERIRSQFTWSRFLHEFLDILQTDYHYRPSQQLKVSVIVPNYRHARYLEERLQSILGQSLHPHELIFLDDASPDDSVEVARRIAGRANVPMQIVVNEKNCGSPFTQWLKGLSLATGDLVWIAESDDSAHPLFLERLAPEFFDPDVALAYCQSALIGSHSERLSDDFLAHTDDIDTDHWRRHFSAIAAEEVEFALSQKNTIPNASAVVFRKPDDLDFADELGKLKFAGDWLFYVMIIRGKKVNYLPEVLNFYRRHEATVTHRSIRDDSQAQESLYVKARVLETYPVSARAVTSSLARSIFEYNDLTDRLDLKRPALSANPLLAEPLARLRSVVDSRLENPSSLRVLLVLSGLAAHDETGAAIELANALARAHTVFLCNAQPHLVDESARGRLSHRLIFVEGTLGPTPWSVADERAADQNLRRPPRRPRVLGELLRLLRIDVVHSHSSAANRLVLASGGELFVPWLIHAGSVLQSLTEATPDPDSRRLDSLILNEARGFFYADAAQLDRLEQFAPSALAGKPSWILEQSAPADLVAACCGEAYLEVRNLIAFPRTAGPGESPEVGRFAAVRSAA